MFGWLGLDKHLVKVKYRLYDGGAWFTRHTSLNGSWGSVYVIATGATVNLGLCADSWAMTDVTLLCYNFHHPEFFP